jgi:hypothetical protein
MEGDIVGNLPDLRPLFYLAVFGFVCAAALAVTAVLFLGYHTFMAISAYIGA